MAGRVPSEPAALDDKADMVDLESVGGNEVLDQPVRGHLPARGDLPEHLLAAFLFEFLFFQTDGRQEKANGAFRFLVVIDYAEAPGLAAEMPVKQLVYDHIESQVDASLSVLGVVMDERVVQVSQDKVAHLVGEYEKDILGSPYILGAEIGVELKERLAVLPPDARGLDVVGAGDTGLRDHRDQHREKGVRGVFFLRFREKIVYLFEFHRISF